MDLLHIWVISATEVYKFHQTMNYLLSYSNVNNRFLFKKSSLAFSCCTDSIVLYILQFFSSSPNAICGVFVAPSQLQTRKQKSNLF